MGSRLAQTPQAKGTVSDETAFVPQTSHRFGLGGVVLEPPRFLNNQLDIWGIPLPPQVDNSLE